MYLSNGSFTCRARRGEPQRSLFVSFTLAMPGPEKRSIYTRASHLFFIPVEKRESYSETSLYLSSVQAPTSAHGSPSLEGVAISLGIPSLSRGYHYEYTEKGALIYGLFRCRWELSQSDLRAPRSKTGMKWRSYSSAAAISFQNGNAPLETGKTIKFALASVDP